MTPRDTKPSSWSGIDWETLPHGGDLFGEIEYAEQARRAAPERDGLWPGIAICAVAAGSAAWLSEHYGFPIMLLGLLVGLSLNFITRDPRTHRGLDFASRTCLRAGIVLLGLQVSAAQIAALGPVPFAALLVVMAATFLAGIGSARLVGQSSHAGLLAGGATAVCGASAALALYGVIGKDRLSQAQFAMTLVGISLASAVAMSVYPAIAGELALNDRQAGFLIGASIHDVAQAIGGGYAYSDAAGSYATLIKLSRVALLAPVVVIASLLLGASSGTAGKSLLRRLALPWFITAFLATVALNSLIIIPQQFASSALALSKALLVLAVTATAMRSRMDLLMEIGWRAAVPVIASTLVSFLVALAFAVSVL
jgi:uncharacterized integral membrane protein (TIGR00698 family)